MKRPDVRSVIVGCASAALLSAAACSNNNRNDSAAMPPAGDASAPAAAEPNAKGTSGSDVQKEALNVSGCLQKKGGDFILTELSEPSTGGASTKGEGDKVAREQLHAAQHAYRLRADNDDDLAKLVGKQVRVRGTVDKKSDLAVKDQPAATSGSKDRASDDRDRRDISAGDLARVDVTSIEQVSASCGSAKGKAKR
jgi:hypothetical protein